MPIDIILGILLALFIGWLIGFKMGGDKALQMAKEEFRKRGIIKQTASMGAGEDYGK